MKNNKTFRRNRIRQRIKKVVSGTSDYPRLSVFRSNKEIYAQLIDDNLGKTIVSASSMEKALKKDKKNKTDLSILLGEVLAKRATEKKIDKVYFDRGGYKYHGRIKALAESLRKNGLNF